jgi:hypothetical protein
MPPGPAVFPTFSAGDTVLTLVGGTPDTRWRGPPGWTRGSLPKSRLKRGVVRLSQGCPAQRPFRASLQDEPQPAYRRQAAGAKRSTSAAGPPQRAASPFPMLPGGQSQAGGVYPAAGGAPAKPFSPQPCPHTPSRRAPCPRACTCVQKTAWKRCSAPALPGVERLASTPLIPQRFQPRGSLGTDARTFV